MGTRYQRTHGMSGTPEYNVWVSLIQRCTNPNDQAWTNYGGRGITVCQEWRESFEKFIAAVGRKPMPGLALDRIDNSRGYEPGNVRWTTYKVNGRNKRSNRIVEWDGEKLTLAELCERRGVNEMHVIGRLRLGHSLADALDMPLRRRGLKQYVDFRGERISVGRLAARIGMHRDRLAMRLKRGWPIEKAVAG